jgi:chemotaxis protein histidine kinase CheA
MRQRLSWDKEKVSAIMKQADPYTMNQDRKNPPASKYDVGGPSQFGEDQHMAHPWESEGRTETGHPAPAREAVVQARKLEDKALKCITIAQRMLPGAEETTLEDQATDLMFLPERSLMATLQRQADLATKIAAEKEEEKPAEETPEEVPADKKAKKEEKPAEEKKPEEEVVEAKKEKPAEEKKPEEEEVVVEAKKEKPAEEMPPVKEEMTPPEEEKKEASDKDLLDILFDNAEMVIPDAPKVGAKKLSGLVKQASGVDPLANLWDAPPDVSKTFK